LTNGVVDELVELEVEVEAGVAVSSMIEVIELLFVEEYG